MTTVTIADVNERGVKPEGAGWANYSNSYEGPRPLVVGATYEVDIKSWIGKKDGKEMWFLNSAQPAAPVHAPPPAPSALPPSEGNTAPVPTQPMPPLPPIPEYLPPVERDERGRSIERQVALKAAVAIVGGHPEFSGVAEEDMDTERFAKMVEATLNMATEFDDWISDTSVPPSQGEPDADVAPRPEYRG